jgi:hypothetical protein
MSSRHGVNAKGGRGDLESCFSMVVVDEAHQRKSRDTLGKCDMSRFADCVQTL